MSENVWMTWTCLGVTVPLGINKYNVNTVYEVSKDIKKELKGSKRRLNCKLKFKLKRKPLMFNFSFKTLNIKRLDLNF